MAEVRPSQHQPHCSDLETLMSSVITVPLLVAYSWAWTCILSIPAWLLWTVCGLGSHYFTFLPPAWQSLSLPHAVALFLLFAIARSALAPLSFELKP